MLLGGTSWLWARKEFRGSAEVLFIEVLRPTQVFPGGLQFGEAGFQPPGNLAQTVFFGDQGSSIAGLVDTKRISAANG